MRNQRAVYSMVLALLLPVTLGLACVKRNWDFCSPSAPCKTGYICTEDWRCMLPDGGSDGLVAVDGHDTAVAAEGGLDGPAPTGTDGPGGAVPGPDAVDSAGATVPDAAPSTPGIDAAGGAGGSSGGPDAAPDVLLAPSDAPSLLTLGSPCSVSNACASGICADAVCCDKACTGCNACAQALTGQPSGTCAPVISGKNAHNFCKDETTTKKCGNDGTCDGAGACRNASTSVVCTDSSCNGSVYTPVSTCDGKGACVAVKTQDCAPFLCAQTGCSKTCVTATDCDDPTAYYCDANRTCAAKLSNGKTASSGSQCTSGVVADGVCCNKDCTGCSACTKALNGQSDGQCLPVPAGKAGHNTCTASNTTCGTTGLCDGSGKCQYGASGTGCGSTCTGSTLIPKTCDGAGACVSGTSSSCAPYVCAATGDVCGGKKALGGSCSSDSDCDSAKCEDNLAGTAKICCSANCSTCQGCNSSGTGCTKKNTSAPDSACGTTAASCQNGTCDNNGACAVTTGALCGAGPSCSAGVVTAAYGCNSSGQCVPGGQTTCSTGACNSAETGCSTGKALGTSCSQGTECSSGFCAGSVCCNRACNGACEQCSAASLGQCTYKTGTQCLAATSCANAAVCSGSSGTCPSPTPKPSGTACGNMGCSGSTQSGATCNGAGSCGASTTRECYPYACVSGSGCKSSCATNADCVGGSSSFCGKLGTCIVDGKCWHATDSSTPPLWQVNPKEIADPDLGPYDPQYHRHNIPGSTPDDVCSALTLCGFDDWVVPTIDELRSLIRGCPSTVTGGTCGVTNACLGTACDAGCAICDYMAGPGPDLCYWPVGLSGPCSGYWTSSVYFDPNPDYNSYRYRFVDFTNGSINSCDPSDGNFVRCVRRSQ